MDTKITFFISEGYPKQILSCPEDIKAAIIAAYGEENKQLLMLPMIAEGKITEGTMKISWGTRTLAYVQGPQEVLDLYHFTKSGKGKLRRDASFRILVSEFEERVPLEEVPPCLPKTDQETTPMPSTEPPTNQVLAPLPETDGIPVTNNSTSEPNILEEANKITHGARRDAYGHPLDDFKKVIGMANALFADKLKAPLEEEDVSMFMIIMKMSRQVNRQKRDNLVDIAGYSWTAQECIEEKERRAQK